MNYIYIDESGTMTNKNHRNLPYFIITKVLVKDRKKLKQVLKRFIKKNLEILKIADTNNKMFENDKFKELKGSCLTPELKISLAKYLCQNNLFEVFYIRINNSDIDDRLYGNTARAFNYMLGLSFSYHLRKGNLKDDSYHLQIDNRNIKTHALKSLEDYLYTKLSLDEGLVREIKVDYFDSEINSLIQIADFFSNLYYSEVMTKKYTGIFEEFREQGYFYDEFVFPLNYK